MMWLWLDLACYHPLMKMVSDFNRYQSSYMFCWDVMEEIREWQMTLLKDLTPNCVSDPRPTSLSWACCPCSLCYSCEPWSSSFVPHAFIAGKIISLWTFRWCMQLNFLLRNKYVKLSLFISTVHSLCPCFTSCLTEPKQSWGGGLMQQRWSGYMTQTKPRHASTALEAWPHSDI